MSEKPAAAPDRLRWRTGTIGCLLPLLAFGTVLFGVAAFRPALVDRMASGRGGAFVEWTSAVTVSGVNLPLALLTIWLTWETFRLAWQWADQIAVRITEGGLEPHGSLYMRPMAWDRIADVRFVRLPAGWVTTPTLLIDLRNGGQRKIRGVDNEDGAAERFAAAARARLGGNRGGNGDSQT